MPKKKMTIEDLGKKIDHMDQKITKVDQNLDNLAIITKKGFDQTEKRFNNLENDHEQIMLRLTNVAYRFEINELKQRVEKLEKKAGIA